MEENRTRVLAVISNLHKYAVPITGSQQLKETEENRAGICVKISTGTFHEFLKSQKGIV